jgi:hypothetical protein
MNLQNRTLLQAFSDAPIVIHRVHLTLTGDYATAAALAQILYWHKKMQRKFYKTDADFMSELLLTPDKWRLVKTKLKALPFLLFTREGVPCRTFIDVDYDLLTSSILALKSDTDPETGLGENPETGLGENPETGLGENPETNTETTSETTSETTTTTQVVVVVKEIFEKDTEQQNALKTLAGLKNQSQAIEVVQELRLMKKKNAIRSSVMGLLYTLCKKANEGTFTATYDDVQPSKQPKAQETAQERINREKAAEKAESERCKQAAKRAEADLAAKQAQVAPPSSAPNQKRKANFGTLAV